MKQVRNRRTGDVGELDFDSKEGVFIVVYYDLNTKEYVKHFYRGINGLSAEWEDYKEPKEYWYIDSACTGGIDKSKIFDCEHCEKIDDFNKSIGNYFLDKKEAKKAVEKLKAWKRLKDKGLHATTFYVEDGSLVIRAKTHNSSGAENWEDLDLLFGGEE